MVGETMRLRYPQNADPWLRTTVDADLVLDGTVEALTLSGTVTVHDALYTKDFAAGVNVFDFGQNQTIAATTASTPVLPLSYDVRITAPSTIRAERNWSAHSSGPV
jgi:hypothetical protein